MTGKTGIEWVKEYHGTAANLSNTKAQAEGFYYLVGCSRSFNWGNDLAWDVDFEEPGDDTLWADKVDIVYFSGHGDQNGPVFGVKNHVDGQAKPSQVRLGNLNLEWLVLDACLVLQETGVFSRWRGSFKGLHYILGFDTTTGDEKYRGTYFALYLRLGYRVRNAWIKACQLTEGSGTHMAYLRADKSGTNTYDDHLWGYGYVSGDPVPSGITLYYFTTPC